MDRAQRGDTLTVSSQSAQFREWYREVHPQSADHVRHLVGLDPAITGEAVPTSGTLRGTPRFVAEAKLECYDDQLRSLAWTHAQDLARRYIMMGETINAHQQALLNKYITLIGGVVRLVFFKDIIILHGGTLVIAPDTHAVYARKIRIHGGSRIACHGSLSFVCRAMIGDYSSIANENGSPNLIAADRSSSGEDGSTLASKALVPAAV